MLSEVKKCAESNDIKGLHYIFVDCLDVDPTFEKYMDDYEYCKSIDGFLMPHIDMTPFLNKEEWNEQYWVQLKMDLMKNFSDRRFVHMRQVAQVIYAEKINRLKYERSQKSGDIKSKNFTVEKTMKQISKTPVKESYLQSTIQNISINAEKPVMTSSMAFSAADQEKQILEKKRALELHNQQVEREQKEQRDRIEAAKQAEKVKKNKVASVDSSKKSLGVAIAVLAVVAIIVVVVLIIVL